MTHDLTIGHLDPTAIRYRLAVAVKPLDGEVVDPELTGFPGLKVERRDGYVIARDTVGRTPSGAKRSRPGAGRDWVHGRRQEEWADRGPGPGEGCQDGLSHLKRTPKR